MEVDTKLNLLWVVLENSYSFVCTEDLYSDFELGLNNGDKVMTGSEFMMNKSVSGTGQVILVDPSIWSCQGWLWFAGATERCFFYLLNCTFLVTCFLPTQFYLWIKWWMSDYLFGLHLCSWGPQMNVNAKLTNHSIAAEENTWWWLQLQCRLHLLLTFFQQKAKSPKKLKFRVRFSRLPTE